MRPPAPAGGLYAGRGGSSWATLASCLGCDHASVPATSSACDTLTSGEKPSERFGLRAQSQTMGHRSGVPPIRAQRNGTRHCHPECNVGPAGACNATPDAPGPQFRRHHTALHPRRLELPESHEEPPGHAPRHPAPAPLRLDPQFLTPAAPGPRPGAPRICTINRELRRSFTCAADARQQAASPLPAIPAGGRIVPTNKASPESGASDDVRTMLRRSPKRALVCSRG